MPLPRSKQARINLLILGGLLVALILRAKLTPKLFPNAEEIKRLDFAIQTGDVQTVTKTLDRYKAIPVREVVGKAIFHKQLPILKMLSERGITLNSVQNQFLLLEVCGMPDSVEIARFLLERGANVNQAGGGGITPLMLAAREQDAGLVRLLLDHGADIEARSQSGETALSLAAMAGRLDTIRLLLERGADIHNRRGVPPLIAAGYGNQRAAMQLLLERGAEVNQVCRIRRGNMWPGTMGGMGGFRGDPTTGSQRGSALGVPHAEMDMGYTPLHCLAHYDTQVVALLLRHGAQVNRKAPGDLTPLHCLAFAPGGKKAANADLLIKAGAEVDALDSEANTPLLRLKNGQTADMARVLLAHGADPNRRNKQGFTPFLAAAAHNQGKLMELLLERGQDINQRTPDGKTALMITVEGPDSEVQQARDLLARGADPALKDQSGETAQDKARRLKRSAMLRALLEADQNPK
jgi:ankyrin repeat protein